MAQVVAHLIDSEEVTSSTLVASWISFEGSRQETNSLPDVDGRELVSCVLNTEFTEYGLRHRRRYKSDDEKTVCYEGKYRVDWKGDSHTFSSVR